MEDRLQIIDLANMSFGESGWSFSISNVSVDYLDQNDSGHYSAGTSAVVRVERSNGIFREEVGYGVSVDQDKGEAISKAKKSAVTDGLKGAVLNFGGDIARKIKTVTPKKCMSGSSSSISFDGNAMTKVAQTSPLQATVKPNSAYKSSCGGLTRYGNQINVPVKPCVNPSVVSSKVSPVPNRVAPLPRNSPPLATPLPQNVGTNGEPISDEELAKIERKKLQQLRQAEFRRKHLLEQAQAQAQASQDKHTPKIPPQQSRTPLKEQPPNQHMRANNNDIVNGLDADDDVLLSTQDMEAMVEIAANNTNMSRRSPLISSPSIAQNPTENSRCYARPTGQKRPDLTSYAFNPEKKSRGT